MGIVNRRDFLRIDVHRLCEQRLRLPGRHDGVAGMYEKSRTNALPSDSPTRWPEGSN